MAEDESSALVERVADELQAALGVRLEILADRFHDTVSGRLEVAADEFEASLWVRRYGGHVDRLRRLSRASEKLVYLFLVNSEPQSFSTLQRSLSLSSSSHAFASIASLLEAAGQLGARLGPGLQQVPLHHLLVVRRDPHGDTFTHALDEATALQLPEHPGHITVQDAADVHRVRMFSTHILLIDTGESRPKAGENPVPPINTL